ncbi:MAG: M16 family metallopeptidase [Acidobacteriota bacterium]
MKRAVIVIGLILAFSLIVFAQNKPLREFEKVKIPPLNPIQTPKFETISLDNGLKIFLFEDKEIPLIKINAIVKGGTINEEKVGQANLFGTVLRTGGTKSMSGDKVDEFLERIGASIESNSSDAYVMISANMLKENKDEVIPLFAEFLTSPAFAEDKIDLAKTKMRSQISRRNDEVMSLSRREFVKLIYGKDSPYASQIEYDDVDNLSREDLIKFYLKYFRPDETLIAVVGDFDAKEMKAVFEKYLGKWQNPTPKPQYSLPKIPEMKPSINFIEKNDVEQTTILLGHLGLRLDDPDYPAINMLSEILGGGMASRIFVQVRTLKGLAYGAGGYMIPAYDHNGAFYFYTSTKPETSIEALTTILDEIKKIKTEKVTDEELKRAKDGYLNGFAFEFDSTDKIARRMLIYSFYGYPENFNEILKSKIEKVNVEDVQNAAKNHLFEDKLAVLVVGKKEIKDKLNSLGEVNVIDVTIPEPKPKETIPEPTEETLKQGTTLMKNVLTAVGEKQIKNLKNISVEGTMSVKTPMGQFAMNQKGIIVYPDKAHFELQTPMGKMEQVLKGSEGYMAMGDQKRPIPESRLKESVNSLNYSFGGLGILRDFSNGKVQAQFIGEKEVKGVKTKVVAVRMDNNPVKIYIGNDNLIYAIATKQTTEQGPKELLEVFTNYKDVKGVKIPFTSKTYDGDEEQESAEHKNIVVNADIPENTEAVLGVK